jgi:hypothetical protein
MLQTPANFREMKGMLKGDSYTGEQDTLGEMRDSEV